jgi:hypothetical protein
LELMVFVDDERGTVVTESVIAEKTNYNHLVVLPGEAADEFLQRVGFPNHGLIVRPNEGEVASALTKGIVDTDSLRRAIAAAAAVSSDGRARVETDMRAHFNPTRMKSLALLAHASRSAWRGNARPAAPRVLVGQDLARAWSAKPAARPLSWSLLRSSGVPHAIIRKSALEEMDCSVRRPSAARNATHEVLGDNTGLRPPCSMPWRFPRRIRRREAQVSLILDASARLASVMAVLDMRKSNAHAPCLIALNEASANRASDCSMVALRLGAP